MIKSKNQYGIVAFHNTMFGLTVKEGISSYFPNTQIGIFTKLDDLLDSIDDYSNIPNFCFMDINLGFPNSLKINSLREVYELFKEKIDIGECKLLGTSFNYDTVENAKNEGLPARIKNLNLKDYEEFLSLSPEDYVEKYLQLKRVRDKNISASERFQYASL